MLISTLAVSLLLGALATLGASPAGAALAFTPCQNVPGFSCAPLTVPLDRSGKTPGTIALTIQRKSASVAGGQSAVLALAGGPGQAADPLGEDLAQAIAPALSTRDLLVFDQRGTGHSSPLNCPVFNNIAALENATESTLGPLVELCALQIGPGARLVHDLWNRSKTSSRSATPPATRSSCCTEPPTARRSRWSTPNATPSTSNRWCSTPPCRPAAPKPSASRASRRSARRSTNCALNRACSGITANPVGDLARLIDRLRTRRLSGSAYDGSGKRHAVAIDELELLDILQAGDLNPALRALLPAAVHSALNGDPDPLLRLNLITEGLVPSVPIRPSPEAERAASEEENNALFLATSCEETVFPWQRSAPAATRMAEALASLRSLPGGDFYPFDATTAMANSLVPICSSWPDAAGAPATPAALPNVPTLILSGGQDTRTPTSNARALASLIPDAQVLIVPYTGHSVLGSDFSGCAQAAVGAFFASAPVQPCTAATNVFAPTPVAPRRLAYVHAPSGLRGKPGRSLTAVLDAIVDLDRQVVAATLQAESELPSGSSFGGLRGGYARLTSSAATLRGFSFVKGVALTGTFPVRNHELQPATIRISGASAAHGTVRLSADKHVSGTLGGKRFDVSLAKVKLSRAGGAGEWPARPVHLPLAALADERPTPLR